MRGARIALTLAALTLATRTAPAQGFDHAKHERVAPSCASCHAGIERSGAPVYPAPPACVACHDGQIETRVTWSPPTGARRTNLTFDHQRHRTALAARPAAVCADCHIAAGAQWMTVSDAVPARCLDCHGLRTEHLAVPDSACVTCHVPLSRSTLSREDIAAIEAPPSHAGAGFGAREGHGAAAKAGTQSCATCHAREFCLSCHVDGPEQPAIAGLASDPRSTAIAASLTAPASHSEPGFTEKHGRGLTDATSCASCHTRESCLACHASVPRGAGALHRASAARGRGAVITRRPPASHTPFFSDRHGTAAAATTATCAGCHVRAECLDCHRPSAGAAVGGYHPTAFLNRHPAAAYARESSCSDCHNQAGFCTSCHVQAGLTASTGALRQGFHDAKQFFLAGHGQAARQSLESCVSCHVERDCLTCHGGRAVGGRGFSPHGPGFDAARLKKKNPNMCVACHGTAIP